MRTGQRDRLVSWGFAGFLAVMAIAGAAWPQRSFSETENRYLTKRPAWSAGALFDGSYGKEYEAYLGDQFPGRDRWVSLYAAARRMQMSTDINGVYLGRDGYWMERFDIEDIEGPVLDRNLERLSAWCAQMEDRLGRGRVKAMLVPSASQVLTDKRPLFAAPYDQHAVVERLAAMAGEGSWAMDVEGALKAHGDEGIYYRTDHHWTALGAYYGYRAWAEDTGRTPWEREDFQVMDASNLFLGTTSAKLNLPHRPDTIQIHLPVEPVRYRVTYDGGEAVGTLYQEAALGTRDQYRVYLDGNHGLTRIENLDRPEGARGQKLLIVKDSFANSFAPFAANHFEETWLVDLRYYRGDLGELVEGQGITDILALYQIPGFSADRNIRFAQ